MILPPIDFDDENARSYIPLPGGWEIQTRGNGSTFRISHIDKLKGTTSRWAVLDPILHVPLEAMARDIHAALQPSVNDKGDPLAKARNAIDSMWQLILAQIAHGVAFKQQAEELARAIERMNSL